MRPAGMSSGSGRYLSVAIGFTAQALCAAFPRARLFEFPMSRSLQRAGIPVVTLLGIPNAGKSTIFNRLLGERRALVTDLPGTTRDRIYARWRAAGKLCLLCDTGGVSDLRAEGLQEEIRRQTFIAVEEAQVVVLVLDALAGLTAGDRELAGSLRPISDRVLVAWNKSDVPFRAEEAAEGYELGLGEPLPISAEHGLGIADLVDAIATRLPVVEEEGPGPEDEIRVAIVGRPNVGKSSLLNRLCGEARVSVSPAPGTTRDAVDTEVIRGNRLYRFVDTAGIRRPSRTTGKVERLGVMAARRAIERADVALVLFDASEGLVSQDLAVAGLVEESGKGAVLVANKWDLVADKDERLKALRTSALSRFRFARFAPMVTVSALDGRRAASLYPFVDRVYEAAGALIPTPKLNRFLATFRASGDARWTPRYITQIGVRPPTFLVFVSSGRAPAHPHVSLVRRMENSLRLEFGIGPTPIRLRFRKEERRPRTAGRAENRAT